MLKMSSLFTDLSDNQSGAQYSMATYASQRPVKAEENHHCSLGTNLIGTLSIINTAGPGVWTPGNNQNERFTLSQALQHYWTNGHLPLLWAYRSTITGYEFKFGYDEMVPLLAVDAPPGAMIKIGHVALTPDATISGEIILSGAQWEIDNNSGAWGAMDNNSGKTMVLAQAAEKMSAFDPGGIVVSARRAYSRTFLKRSIQQIFR
jgi:hypothetical protein